MARLEISPGTFALMTELAQLFRREPTPSEAILWNSLRNRKFYGLKFRRQQPIGPFIVDFVCSDLHLVVEVDGPIHDSKVDADEKRQSLIESCGYRFFRISALSVEGDLEGVLQRLALFVSNLTSSRDGNDA